MKRLRKILSVILLGILLAHDTGLAWAAGTLSINFIAVNASDQPKQLDIDYDLPKELDAPDILDAGGLELTYDIDKKTYRARGKVSFQAKESKTFKVTVRDVWIVKADEIDALKKQLAQNVDSLKNHENYEAAQEAQNQMVRELDFIMAQQTNYSDNIERRIEEFRAFRQTMDDIKNNIYSMDYLRFESRALKELRDNQKLVKFIVEVKNPSDTEERTVTQKHYLPEEVRAENVVDAQGFDVRFDGDTNRSYLSKEETFAPGETKRYEILLRDIWWFPMIKLQDLDDRSQIAAGELAGTIYEESASNLLTKIAEKIKEMRDIPSEGLSVDKHIGVYRTKVKKFESAWEDFKRIEEMIAIVRAKKLEEMEQKKVKNVLNRLKALRGLKTLSEALFKKTIAVTTTWKIIFGTIIFVALFTTIHFAIWTKRSAKAGEENAAPEGIKVVPKPGQPTGAEK